MLASIDARERASSRGSSRAGSTRRWPRRWAGCSTPRRRCSASAPVAQYEGQAAMELEALAGGRRARAAAVPVRRSRRTAVDARPASAPRRAGGRGGGAATDAGRPGRGFHESVAAHGDRWRGRAAERRARTVVRSAAAASRTRGCSTAARATGLRRGASACCVPRRLSPNDGAISYGQAAVAAARPPAAPTSRPPHRR